MHTSNINHPKQKNRLITLVLAMVLGIFGEAAIKDNLDIFYCCWV